MNTEQHSGSFVGARGRRGAAVFVAGLALVLAAAPVSAQAPPEDAMFVHSAQSGELGGGRLTLHGVGRRVTWAHRSGRSGVVRVTRLHRLLFSPSKPAATGTLHVAGHHGGDELTLRLSRPHYNAGRRTVSYRVRQLGNGRLPRRGAGAGGFMRRFGPASLSILGAPEATDGPSVQVQANSYGCPSDPTGLRCFGTVSASGLAPGSEVNTYVDGISEPINTFVVDQNGNLGATRVAMVCATVAGFSVSGQAPDGSTVSAHADRPAVC